MRRIRTLGAIGLICLFGALVPIATTASAGVAGKAAVADERLPLALDAEGWIQGRLVEAARAWYGSDETRDRELDGLMNELVDGIGLWLRDHILDPRAHRAEIAALALAAEGQRHPLVPFVIGAAMLADASEQPHGIPWRPLFDEAIAGLVARSAPAEIRLEASGVATMALRPLYAAHVHRRHDELHVDAYLELVRRWGTGHRIGGGGGGAGDGADALLWLARLDAVGARIVAMWPPDLAERTLAELDEIEGVDECLRLTLRGVSANRRGWRARGTAFAFRVTDEQWEGFAEGLEAAREALTKAWELDPRRVTAAINMIEVATGLGLDGDEAAAVWFDRAVANQPDSPGAWLLGMWSQRPRWGGSMEGMHELLRRLLEAGGERGEIGDSVVTLLASAVHHISEEHGDIAWIGEPATRELIERARARLEASPRVIHRRRVVSLAILAAIAADDHARAAELLATLTPPGRGYPAFDARLTQGYRVDPNAVVREIWALGGRYAPVVRAADEHWHAGRHAEAARLLRGLLAEAERTDDPFEIVDALRDRLVTIETELAYASGDWIRLPIEPGLPGWRVKDGRWRAAENGLRGDAMGAPVRIESTLRPGPRYEVRARVGVPGRTSWTSAGILADFVDRVGGSPRGAPTFRAAIWYPRQPESPGAARGPRGQVELQPRPMGDTQPVVVPLTPAPREAEVVLHMVVFDDAWGLLVDGVVVAEGPLAPSSDGSGTIAFGTRDRLPGNAGPVRISDIEVRRLDAPPPGLRLPTGRREDGPP